MRPASHGLLALASVLLPARLSLGISTPIAGISSPTASDATAKEKLVWGVMSCPSCRQMGSPALYLQSWYDRAAVHCCRDEPGGGAASCGLPTGDACHARATFQQAHEMCQGAHMRLCTKEELLDDRCCSECGGNKTTLVWSRTPVVAPRELVMHKGSQFNQHTGAGDAPVFDKKAMLCRLKNAVMGRALNYHLANDFTHSLPSFGKCALVSSSGVLNYHNHGAAIDAADTIIRFNDAPVAGFQSIVGSKTHLRIVNEKLLEEWVLPEHSDIKQLDACVGLTCVPVALLSTCTICNVGTFKQLTPDGFHVRENAVLAMNTTLHLYSSNLGMEKTLDSFFKQLFKTEESPAGVTTGSVGMALALSMCDQVKAYGMALSPQTNKDSTPYHYYDKKVDGHAATASWHKSFDAEKLLWRSVADSQTEVDRSDIASVPGFRHLSCHSFETMRSAPDNVFPI